MCAVSEPHFPTEDDAILSLFDDQELSAREQFRTFMDLHRATEAGVADCVVTFIATPSLSDGRVLGFSSVSRSYEPMGENTLSVYFKVEYVFVAPHARSSATGQRPACSDVLIEAVAVELRDWIASSVPRARQRVLLIGSSPAGAGWSHNRRMGERLAAIARELHLTLPTDA